MNSTLSSTSWHGLRGQDGVVEQFRRAVARGRLASSFLFAGPPGVGKRTFALKLAQTLLCQTNPETAFDPCGYCPSCVQVEAGTHPDLIFVCKPADRANILVESIIGDDEHRMQEGLLHDISLKPFMGGRKIAIIDDADYLKAEGANALLKTLEEPPPRSVLVLIGTSPAKQLPTIRSRCQLIRFQPLDETIVADLLLEKGLTQNEADARRLAQYSGGSLERAIRLSDPELWTFRGTLYQQLAEGAFDNVAFAPTVAKFVEAAGKEAPRAASGFTKSSNSPPISTAICCARKPAQRSRPTPISGSSSMPPSAADRSAQKPRPIASIAASMPISKSTATPIKPPRSKPGSML